MIKMKPNKRLKLVITVIVFMLMLIAVVPRAKSIYDLYAIKKTLLQQKAQLTQVNQERTQTLAEIDTPQGMEKLAREQLGMVKKGERTIIKVIP